MHGVRAKALTPRVPILGLDSGFNRLSSIANIFILQVFGFVLYTATVLVRTFLIPAFQKSPFQISALPLSSLIRQTLSLDPSQKVHTPSIPPQTPQTPDSIARLILVPNPHYPPSPISFHPPSPINPQSSRNPKLLQPKNPIPPPAPNK